MYISAASVLLNRVFDGFKYIPIVFKKMFRSTTYFIPASFNNSLIRLSVMVDCSDLS